MTGNSASPEEKPSLQDQIDTALHRIEFEEFIRWREADMQGYIELDEREGWDEYFADAGEECPARHEMANIRLHMERILVKVRLALWNRKHPTSPGILWGEEEVQEGKYPYSYGAMLRGALWDIKESVVWRRENPTPRYPECTCRHSRFWHHERSGTCWQCTFSRAPRIWSPLFGKHPLLEEPSAFTNEWDSGRPRNGPGKP